MTTVSWMAMGLFIAFLFVFYGFIDTTFWWLSALSPFGILLIFVLGIKQIIKNPEVLE